MNKTPFLFQIFKIRSGVIESTSEGPKKVTIRYPDLHQLKEVLHTLCDKVNRSKAEYATKYAKDPKTKEPYFMDLIKKKTNIFGNRLFITFKNSRDAKGFVTIGWNCLPNTVDKTKIKVNFYRKKK